MRPIPAWLEPHKNKWLTVAKLQGLIDVEGGRFNPWFDKVRPRLRVVTEHCRTTKGLVRRYLVKQIWACSLAHNVTLVPASLASDRIKQIESLQREVFALQTQLAKAEAEANTLVTPDNADAVARVPVEMLRKLLSAEPPKPEQGVYFLLDGAAKVIYVGQSTNVLARMAGHVEKQFASVKMITTKTTAERLETEALYIKAMRPPLNRAGLPDFFPQSQKSQRGAVGFSALKRGNPTGLKPTPMLDSTRVSGTSE